MNNIFSIYHPIVIFTYVVSVLVFTMLTLNPVNVMLSFYVGSLYSIYLMDFKEYLKTLKYSMILFVVVAIANPFFNHEGLTVLFYNPWDNSITLEAIAYGINSGAMLASVFIWFRCYNALMNNDKFLYIFGKFLPTISLMLSMIMKWIPVTKHKITSIHNAQKALGMGMDTGSREIKIQRGIRLTSILMSWSMEDSLETADSMKARGYGCMKRTSYSIFSWGTHDIISMILISILIIIDGSLIIGGVSSFDFYPTFSGGLFTPEKLVSYCIYLFLLSYPLLLEGKEEIQWVLSRQRI